MKNLFIFILMLFSLNSVSQHHMMLSVRPTVGSSPVANFTANTTSGDAPLSVNFTDLSSADPTEWDWTFTGASPGTSTAENPTNITYSSAGAYTVSLTATNSYGEDTETKTSYITVTEPNPATTLTTNLISVWEFDETSGSTAIDAHSDNDLTNNTYATINQTGKIDKAYDYNGSTSELARSSASDFEGLSDVSVSAWVKIDALPTSDQYRMIFSKHHSSWGNPYYQISLRVRSGTNRNYFVYFIGTSSSQKGVGSGVNSVSINTWYNVVGTYNGTTGVINIYINNVYKGTATLSGGGNTGTASTPIYVGDDSDLYSLFYPWDGLIDQVAVWDKVLTTTEISDLYNNGAGLKYINW